MEGEDDPGHSPAREEERHMPGGAGQPRIFVSYARRDGRELAAELRARLAEHGFSLWQDLADMEGGRDWWRQITEAVDGVEHVLLAVTPGALASEVVRREWRYARQQGRCVVPVTKGGTAGLDLANLAGWMRRAHFVDVDVPEQWTRLVRTLEGPCTVHRVPLMVEPPHHFVPRPAEYERLKRALLDGRGEPVAITAALKGAGGYGKTTLAREARWRTRPAQ
jgi:TIR domain